LQKERKRCLSENENRRKALIQRYGQREKDLHRLADQVQELGHESEDCKIKALELQKSLDEAMAVLEKDRKGLVLIEAVIKEFDDVLLFGPTSAKNELLNLLRQNHLFEKIKIELKPADKMTENQQQAFVREYFISHP